MAQHVEDISWFLSARRLSPLSLASAAGITPDELDQVLTKAAGTGTAAERVCRCIAKWDRTHATSCEGYLVLQSAGNEIWRIFNEQIGMTVGDIREGLISLAEGWPR